MGLFNRIFGSPSEKELRKIQPITDAVLALEPKYAAFSAAELRGMTDQFRAELKNGKTTDDILVDAFAVCREAAWRVLGMKHFPVQITGGVVLHRGSIAEMKTGEGKTLVATLPCYLNALSGEGVHVVTVNDYLARRDSEWMGKVYRFLGLTVGLVIPDIDPEARHAAYRADITFGTNNEFGFDYLRDNMVGDLSAKVQRGHAFAVVDEVDSILIDEARTPLIISGRGDKSSDMYRRADQFVRTLKKHVVVETDDKTALEELGGDYIVDEKARTVTLTATGIEKAQRYFGVANLQDAENMSLLHYINQAIRAHGIMKRDVDYVVKDGEVIIVDEFTGRLMIGRRYSQGLHQAIEAKENVRVARESRTLATITFQNYFRMYKKLCGMTGTAMTEANEFLDIYGLDVISIPTNKPMIRVDRNDLVYTNLNAKYNAVIERVCECYRTGQPVLVGTISVEKSELLSRMLKKRGVPHNVLNAKQHEREAYIVSQASRLNAVTIATNMAGRGTDIILGGNAEMMARLDMQKQGCTDEQIMAATSYSDTDDAEVLALRQTFRELVKKHEAVTLPEGERVRALGGLLIIGTERHENRRIDNQLRGRAGRQGDPGASQFYLSLEDDLMRIFGGDRIQSLMPLFNLQDDQPIEHKALTSVIESSQKRLESNNYAIRKSVLSYDDVMNAQREQIYAERDMVLRGENIREKIIGMLEETIRENVALYLSSGAKPADWNLTCLRDHYLGWLTLPKDFRYTPEELAGIKPSDIEKELIERAHGVYAAREAEYGDDKMRLFERLVLLRVVDTKWMAHIDAMDELRRGIGLRSFAQHDPVVEYRNEGYAMFDEMVAEIRADTAKMILTARLVEEQRRPQEATATSADGTAERRPQKSKKIGRNDPCPCGSGKKYKHCCGRNA